MRLLQINRLHLALIALILAVTVWSAIGVEDYFTWRLEVFPAFLGFAILAYSYTRFQFTGLVYTLIALHAVVLLVGGHYTYAKVPAFNWLRDTFDLSRNYYDRLGHFVQGFVPAMVARELLLRNSPLKQGKWLFGIVTLSCLGISAAYELLEWQVSLYSGEGGDAFLGTQGDIWDTQKDMFMAGIGAMLALLLLGKLHDKQLKALR